jgi:hypothetical protein
MAPLAHTQHLFPALSAESNVPQSTASLHNLRPNDVAMAGICTLAAEEPVTECT